MKQTYTSIQKSLAILAVAFAASCSNDKNIVEYVTDNDDFSTLASAVETAGLVETLSGEGPFTVFAPTNKAFEILPSGLVSGLSKTQLADVLKYHVSSGILDASEVVGKNSITTLGGTVDVAVIGDTVVLDGRVQISTTDVEVSNGIIHVIDAVLLDGDFPGDIVDALAASPRFSELVGAVTTADLVDTLKGENGGDGFTVFAPDNAAFESITIPTNVGQLTDILTYHVIASTVNAEAAIGVAEGMTPDVATVQGDNITLSISGSDLKINGETTVTYTDIVTSNGIIHAIDKVLIP